MNREFVCVSQGLEIYRTKSQEDAINFVKKENAEYFDYLQQCEDNYEPHADNYIELHIEYDYVKQLQQEKENLIKYLEDGIKHLNKIMNDGKVKPYGEEKNLYENSINRYYEILEKVRSGKYE